MRPTQLRTTLLGLVIWAATLAVSLVAWVTLWQLGRWAVTVPDPSVMASYAAPVGVAVATVGLFMGARTVVLLQHPPRAQAPVRPQAPPRH